MDVRHINVQTPSLGIVPRADTILPLQIRTALSEISSTLSGFWFPVPSTTAYGIVWGLVWVPHYGNYSY